MKWRNYMIRLFLIFLVTAFVTGCSEKQNGEQGEQILVVTPAERKIISEQTWEGDLENENDTSEITSAEVKKELELMVDVYGEGLLCKVINNSSVDLGTGPEFEIERLENGQWEKIPFRENWVFTTESWTIQAYDTSPESISLEECFGHLKSGTYKLKKEVYFKGIIELEAEFTL